MNEVGEINNIQSENRPTPPVDDTTFTASVVTAATTAAAAIATATAAAAATISGLFSDNNDILVLPGDLSLEDISILEEGEIDSLDDGDSDTESYASATNRFVPVTGVVNPLVNRANGSRGNNANSNTTSAQNRRHPQPSSSSRDRATANQRKCEK